MNIYIRRHEGNILIWPIRYILNTSTQYCQVIIILFKYMLILIFNLFREQDVMKDPHVAEDGFSYELEAIKEWLGTGHDTSPMTNLKLKHKHLSANHTLRSLIEDWHNKRSIPLR